MLPIDRLSTREREIAILLSSPSCPSTDQISKQLKISGKTVQQHQKHAFEKLGISSRSELIRIMKQSAIMLVVIVSAMGQPIQKPHAADIKRASLFPFNVWLQPTNGSDSMIKLTQAADDPPDRFEVEVQAMSQAKVTVWYELDPVESIARFNLRGAVRLSKTSYTNTPPLSPVAEFNGIPRTAVRSVSVALVSVIELSRYEFDGAPKMPVMTPARKVQ